MMRSLLVAGLVSCSSLVCANPLGHPQGAPNSDSPDSASLASGTQSEGQSPEQARQNATRWLMQMSRSAREANYQGILVFGDPANWHTLEIQHGFHEGTEYEKITHLTGAPREIVRVGRKVVWAKPGVRVAPTYKHASGLITSGADNKVASVTEHYQVQVVGTERVAGRMARKIELSPSDQFRFGQQLWLDEQTGLLLRCDLQNESGDVVERYQFATVEIGDELPISGLVNHPSVNESAQALSLKKTPSGKSPAQSMRWVPNWVPKGFDSVSQSEMPSSGEVQTYSDGMSAFSLFVDMVKGKPMPDMSQRWGATSAVVRHLQKDGERVRVTVVGEIPMTTAREVAYSVRYQSSQ
jgi:sigma-E factor negative regulatory protein RseB